MFRHKKIEVNEKKDNSTSKDVDKKKEEAEKKEETTDELKEEVNGGKLDKTNSDSTRELLEKNLKWSQIIYEQNRKINRKLVWAALAGWLRLLIILIPLAFALFYMPPIIKQIWNQYSSLTSMTDNYSTSTIKSSNTLDNLMKILNLTPKQQEQVNNLTK